MTEERHINSRNSDKPYRGKTMLVAGALEILADFGILRLIVDKVDLAKRALKENGCTVGKTNVIAVEVPDRVGGLASVLKTIEAAGLNVEYMYAFVNKSGEKAVLIFRFEDMDKAIESLVNDGYTLLTSEQLCKM